MDEQTIRQIVELTNQLQILGCSIELDNTGQIVVYTGVQVSDEDTTLVN